jgi:MFS family permease
MAKEQKKGSSNFGAKGWFIIIVCFFYFYLSCAVTSDGLNTILPTFLEKFQCEKSQLTIFATLGGWLALVSIPIFTFLSKKKGTKFSISVALVISAIATYFIFNAWSIPVFGVALVLDIIAIIGFSMIGTGQLGANWFPTKKGLFMGWATFGIVASAATTNLTMSALINKVGVGNTSWFYIGITAIVLFVTLFFVKNNPEEAGAFPDNDRSLTTEKAREIFEQSEYLKKTSPWTVKKVLGLKATWGIAFGWGMLMMGAAGIISQFVMASMEFGHAPSYPIYLLTVMAPVGLFFSWFIGWIDDKYSTKAASIFVGCMLVFGAVVAGLFGADKVALAIGGGCFMGAMSGGNNLTMSITGTKFGRFDFSSAWAVISVMTRIISSSGIVLVSLIADKFNYKISYLSVAATVVVAMIIIKATDTTRVGRVTLEDAEIAK